MKVKELKISYKSSDEEWEAFGPLKHPENVLEFAKKMGWTEEPQECVYIIVTNCNLEPICFREVSRGTLNESMMHPRDVFLSVLLVNGHGFFMLHNHPSGNCRPSKEDLLTTERLVQGANILGFSFYDHLILTENGIYSIRHNHPDSFK